VKVRRLKYRWRLLTDYRTLVLPLEEDIPPEVRSRLADANLSHPLVCWRGNIARHEP